MANFYSSFKGLYVFLFCFFISAATNAQYCTTGLYYNPCSYNIRINSFSTTGGSTNITNNNSACGTGGYTYFSTMTHSSAPGTTVNFSVTHGSYYGKYKIWVDWNSDNDFVDAGEEVYSGSLNPSQTISSNFVIPAGATTGVKRMRVRCNAYGYYSFTPCGVQYYGECEDYNLNVCTPFSITTQPTNKNVCVNSPTTFNVAPTTATGYQWQVNTGSGFANITNGGSYSGATTATLTVNPQNASLNGAQFRVNAAGCGTVTSNAASLVVRDSTTIGAQSASGSYCDGMNTNLIIQTAGLAPTSILWFVNENTGSGFVPVPNAAPYNGYNNDTLTINPLTSTMNNYTFRATTNGSCNRDTSIDITVAVNVLPGFLSGPGDENVYDGDNASFTAAGQGAADYQWQAITPNGSKYVNINDNANYGGTHSNSLTINNASLAQTGYRFRCMLRGQGNCDKALDTTEPAVLNVMSRTTSVNEISKGAKIGLYPNPAKGDEVVVNILSGTSNRLELRITDKIGRTIRTGEITISANTGKIDVSKLVPGVYSVILSDKDHALTETIKFVKE